MSPGRAPADQVEPAPRPAAALLGVSMGGRYALSRVIGRGGVGVVYLATDLTARRDVVVKVLADDLSEQPEAVARFEREAQRLNALRHPNIVTMLDHGHDQGSAYLVMEYVRGRLLGTHVGQRKRLELEEFVPIAAQVLKGMGYAHSRELMIRDIKASNIMLCERKGRSNYVKILDFGLAKYVRGETPITRDVIVGTAGYLAPEALQGAEPDLRVDVYAAGVLFYYMLAGRLPFQADSEARVMYQTVNDPVPDLSTRLPPDAAIPRALIDLIQQCLEKDPDQRPADANAVVERLISSVPTSMFRLPHALSARSLPSRQGNTGLFGLIDEHPRSSSPDRSAPEPSLPLAAPPKASVAWFKGHKVALSGAVVAVVFLAGFVSMRLALSDHEPPERERAALASLASQTDSQATLANAEPPPAPPPAPAQQPPPAPEVRERPTTATVTVDSQPSATLWIDGRRLGPTPHRGTLAPGPHAVRLEVVGYEPWVSTYEVATHDNAPLLVQLTAVRTREKRPRAKRRRPAPARRPAAEQPPPAPDPPAEPDPEVDAPPPPQSAALEGSGVDGPPPVPVEAATDDEVRRSPTLPPLE